MNATDTGEIRVAILENGDLAEIFIERKSHVQQTGNIYKGKVVNVEPSLQAAFVDLGLERNGFLHASDCIPPDGGYTELLKGGAKLPATSETQQVTAPAAAPEVISSPDAEAAAVPAAQSETEATTPTTPADPPAAAPRPQGDRRRRRRRGGRGRSGRGRAPSGSAPMVAPAPDSSAEPPPDSSTEPEIPESEAAAAEFPSQTVPQTPDALPAETTVATPDQAPSPDLGEASGDDPGEAPEPAEDVPPAEGGLQTSEAAANAEAQPGQEAATDAGATVQTPAEDGATSAREGGPQQRGGDRRGRDRDRGGRGGNGHERRYLVQEMLRRGNEVLVQVAKEGMGQKGPALTTYLSLPGRYLVLMPAVQRLGVSKRIESEEQRRALKDILAKLNPPEGMGVIVRTAGMGRSQEELQRDFDFLLQKWEALKKKAQIARGPTLLFQEGDVITRVFRDVLTDDVSEIIVDDAVVMERAREFLREMSPGSESKIRLYPGAEPLFHKHGVERQLQQLFNRKVPLKGGGSIVIEQTEALVAIDVNTGRYREKHSQDETILATNLEAAREVARQLRLRDIGGLVMIDFIDMDHPEHRRRVEREFKAHLARDKARINVLPISQLGIVEMTRQRVRHSLRRALFDRCTHCGGLGQVKTPETIGLEVLRELREQIVDQTVTKVRVTLHSTSACAILNKFRRELIKLEDARGVSVEVVADDRVQASQFQVFTARAGGDFVLKKVSEVDDYVRNS